MILEGRRPRDGEVGVGGYDGQVPSVRRALDVLEFVARADDTTAGSIADAVDGSRSGMYALLNTLRDREWLVRDDGGAYRVGPGLQRVAGRGGPDDRALCRALAGAVDQRPTRETVALVRPDGPDRLVVAVHDGNHRVRTIHRVGEVRDARTADGLVLTTGPHDDPTISWVRPGVAQTVHDDLTVLAAPVCRDGRRPVAAVLVEVPAQRVDDVHLDEVASAIADLASETSHRIGAPTWQPWGRVAGDDHGPSRALDQAEVTELLRGHHAAQLACLRDDGTPHAVPLWFDWDGEAIWLTASPGSAWASYVRGGGPVSLTIEEPRPHLRRVFVTGRAEPVDDEVVAAHVDGGIVGLRRRLLRRSVGADAASVADDAAGWTAVRVVPDRIHGRAGLDLGTRADEHADDTATVPPGPRGRTPDTRPGGRP